MQYIEISRARRCKSS